LLTFITNNAQTGNTQGKLNPKYYTTQTQHDFIHC